jgi:predicted Zn finger-like uncharacterized protein
MILTCPNCSTRYQADATRFPLAGRKVRCAKCAHVWHQLPPAPEPEPELAIVAAQASAVAPEVPPQFVARSDPPPPVVPRSDPPPAIVTRSEPHASVTRAEPPSAWATTSEPPPARVTRGEPPLIARARTAPQVSAFAPGGGAAHADTYEDAPPGVPLFARLATAAGWAGLALVVLLIGWATLSFRGDVIAFWPQSASLYKAVGLSLRAKGIQLVAVTDRVETEDGAHVLIVSGRLVNNSSRELPVPPIRIALTDTERRELYHWPVVTSVPSLKPGQTAPFQARLANPPGRMHDVEVTFARADE